MRCVCVPGQKWPVSMPYLIPPLIMIFSKGFDTAGVFGGGGDRLRQDGDGVSCETPILGENLLNQGPGPWTQSRLADNMIGDDQGCDW